MVLQMTLSLINFKAGVPPYIFLKPTACFRPQEVYLDLGSPTSDPQERSYELSKTWEKFK